jgi:hypothetical protein
MKTPNQSVLPEGWEILRFPATIEIRNDSGELVHVHPVPYNEVSLAELKHQAITFALDPCLRSACPSGHSQNGFQLHYKV